MSFQSQRCTAHSSSSRHSRAEQDRQDNQAFIYMGFVTLFFICNLPRCVWALYTLKIIMTNEKPITKRGGASARFGDLLVCGLRQFCPILPGKVKMVLGKLQMQEFTNLSPQIIKSINNTLQPPCLQWDRLQWHSAYSDTFFVQKRISLYWKSRLLWHSAYSDTFRPSQHCHCKRGGLYSARAQDGPQEMGRN